MTSTKFGGTMHMFESAKSKFDRFSAIRDQEVKVNTALKAKSPQQIKREHMRTSIPMFAETLKCYRLKKTGIHLEPQADASHENVFLIRDKSADPPLPCEVDRYRLDLAKRSVQPPAPPARAFPTEQLLHHLIEPKHFKRKAFYQYDLKRPAAGHVSKSQVSLSLASLSRMKPKKKLGEILQPGLLDMRLHPVHASQLLREAHSFSRLPAPGREHASHFA